MQNKPIISRTRFLGLALLLALLVFTSCTLPTPPAATLPNAPVAGTETPSATALAGTSWQLVSFGAPGAESPMLADSTVTLEFTAAGEVGGSGGCNTYGGAYEVQENMLIFGEMVSTLMACTDQAVTEQEIAYLAALQAAGRYAITHGMLTIWYDNENGMLNFVEATPTTPLDATPVITPGATITTTATVTPSTATLPGA